MHIVIVGNGPAAIAAAEIIRERDQGCELTLISKEALPFYSPCALAEYVEQRVPREHLFLREQRFYARHHIEMVLGRAATAVDGVRKRVTIGTGAEAQHLEFDRLLIASGARAILPPIPGLEGTPGVFTLKTLADADGIVAHLPRARRAVVIGSGFIGLEAAQALARRGLSVTVVEAMGHVLPQMLDAELASRVERRLTAHGVDVRLSSPAESITGGPGGVTAIRAGGVELSCELVVCAAGVRPDIGWLSGSGIATATGILVDEHMETSVPGIFAAGDVVETNDTSGHRRIVANWPNAVNGGRIAGLNMAGVERRFRGLEAVNVLRVFDVPVAAFGAREGERTLLVETAEGVRKLTLSGDRIVGGQIVGDVDGAGVYLGLMNKGVDVRAVEAGLLSQHFGLGCLLPAPTIPVRRRA